MIKYASVTFIKSELSCKQEITVFRIVSIIILSN